MAGVIFYPDHRNFLHISNKAALLSHHSCVYWTSSFNLLQELLFCGNSLAVQRFGLCAFTAEGPGLIPGWGTKIQQAAHSQGKNFKKNSSAFATWLTVWHRRASFPVSALDVPSSLSYIISSISKVRDVRPFLSLEHLEVAVGLLTGLISILLCLRE